MSGVGRFDAFRALAMRRGRAGAGLLDTLAERRAGTVDPPGAWSPQVAERLGLPHAARLGPAGYYADLAGPHGRRHVRVCAATACFAARGGQHVSEVERELGVRTNGVSADGAVSLQAVRCLGSGHADAVPGDAFRCDMALLLTAASRPRLAARFPGQPPHGLRIRDLLGQADQPKSVWGLVAQCAVAARRGCPRHNSGPTTGGSGRFW
jgi:Thioredoxin-like [2Fe-2S] ferredoxin